MEFPSDCPREELIEHLQADFTPEPLVVDTDARPGSLRWLVAHMITEEDVEERLMSDANAKLGEDVYSLLESARITDGFKDYIVGEIRSAHSYETRVRDSISPSMLGFDNGEFGIFDPTQATALEAQCMRAAAFFISAEHVKTHRKPDGGIQVFMTDPTSYAERISQLNNWHNDFCDTNNFDPFAGVDPEMYLSSGTQVEQADASPEFIANLGRLSQHQAEDDE